MNLIRSGIKKYAEALYSKQQWQWISSVNSGSNNKILNVTEEDGVRIVTMNDPATRNALSMEMLSSLLSAVTATDPSLRCVILNAVGPVFSAGHNLKHIHGGTRVDHTTLFNLCADLMLAVRAAPVPVIAEVNGVAAAAGCQLVAACDIAIASHQSTFSTPGGAVGIFCSTPGIPLVRCVPPKVASYMLMTGRSITAQEALQAGLVSRVVPAHLLEAEKKAIVDSIVSKSKSVLTLGKKFMYKQMNLNEEDAYREGSCVMVDNINMTDGREGIKSFVEKRKPNWTHSDT